ncbi:MAG: AAA family ATPase [Lachnospiraceae bacterium]|nr:AAA family ATPase [Lachnospiraceae bacterium]
MSKLIILRGNSGSGKSSVAKELQRQIGRNTHKKHMHHYTERINVVISLLMMRINRSLHVGMQL